MMRAMLKTVREFQPFGGVVDVAEYEGYHPHKSFSAWYTDTSFLEWSESNIYLAEGDQLQGKLKWRPQQRGVVEALDTKGIKQVTLKVHAQWGKSQLLGARKLYIACVTRDPALFVMPSAKVLNVYLKDKVYPNVRNSPAIKDAVLLNKEGNIPREGLEYKGGYIPFGTARAIGSMQNHPARIVIADELDRFVGKTDASNPLDLLRQRMRNFKDGCLYVSSTPGDAMTSLIEREYAASDQREYYMPCPECDSPTRFLWENVRRVNGGWELCTECCGYAVDEYERLAMLWGQGEWKAAYPEVTDHIGFHTNAFYSYTQSFDSVMSDYNENDTKGFTTQVLAKAYTLKMDDPISEDDARDLHGSRPESPLFATTAAVDWQGNRVELTVVRWYGTDFFALTPYVECHQAIYRGEREWVKVYEEALGVAFDYNADVVFVDVGSNRGSNLVKNSCLAAVGMNMKDGRVVCIKGGGSQEGSTRWKDMPYFAETVQGKQPLYGCGRAADKTLSINSSVVKLNVVPDLKSGRIVLNDDRRMFTEDFYAQLGAEELTRYYTGVEERLRWRKVRERNEAFDNITYCYAGLEFLGRDYRPRNNSKFEMSDFYYSLLRRDSDNK